MALSISMKQKKGWRKFVASQVLPLTHLGGYVVKVGRQRVFVPAADIRFLITYIHTHRYECIRPDKFGKEA